MALIYYNPSTIKKTRTGVPSVSFSTKSGIISINKFAVEKTGFKSNTKISIVFDNVEGQLHILSPKDGNGFDFRDAKNGCLAMNSIELAKSCQRDYEFLIPSFTCILGQATEIDGQTAYPLIKIKK